MTTIFSQSYQFNWHANVLLQFFSIVYTHFLKACLILSELYTQIKKHTHNGQNPSILLWMNGKHFFSIHHSVLHWAHQCSTGSYKCLHMMVCVSFVFWFVCRVLRVWGMLSENVCKQWRKTVNLPLFLQWGLPGVLGWVLFLNWNVTNIWWVGWVCGW